ncbi:MAG: response regulator [Candidatus Neomarinimicrobiota bacterium]
MKSRILVVDDEKFIVEAISQHLTQCGYDVSSFVDANDALKAIQAEQFDLVLTDLRMPDISGMDITRAVYEKKTDTMVLILTGYATLDSAIESVHLQVYAYLNKPFDLRQLGQVVERALTEQRLKRENEILQAQIGKMLHDVTTLHEVTRLLYDTNDWDMTMEFVLDTLSLGFGITHSCLLFVNAQGEYSVGKVNFPDKSPLHAKVPAYPWQELSGLVSEEDLTVLENRGETNKLFKKFSADKESLSSIYFIPIRYRDIHLGFLTVFSTAKQQAISDDQITLLRILATQIAPQVYADKKDGLGETVSADIAVAQGMLRLAIDSSLGEASHFGVNLLRFVTPRPLTNFEEIGTFHNTCADLTRRHEPKADLLWLTVDTAFALFPDSNLAQSDITCMALAKDFQETELADLEDEGTAELIFASAVWPQEASGTAEIIYLAWSRLLAKIQSISSQVTPE